MDATDGSNDAAAPRIKVSHIDDESWIDQGVGDPFAGFERGDYIINTSVVIVDGVASAAGSVCLFHSLTDCEPLAPLTVVEQPQPDGAPPISVVRFASLTVPENVTIYFIGENPIAFLVRGMVNVRGTLNVGARGRDAGVGGRSGAAVLPCEPPVQPYAGAGVGPCGIEFLGAFQGGSGGAHRGSGGEAGHSNWGHTPVIGAPWNALLIGGGAGGAGVRTDVGATPEDQPFGGGGGGALQISAQESIAVAQTGILNAVGGGGRIPNPYNQTAISSGGGGGAGGMIFLEARRIDLDGTIAVTGGGGGGADDSASKRSYSGEDGSVTGEISAGGDSTTPDQPGGRGGSAADRNGGDGGKAGSYGAGGGGGGGRIILKTVDLDEDDDPILVPAGCTERIGLEFVDE